MQQVTVTLIKLHKASTTEQKLTLKMPELRTTLYLHPPLKRNSPNVCQLREKPVNVSTNHQVFSSHSSSGYSILA